MGLKEVMEYVQLATGSVLSLAVAYFVIKMIVKDKFEKMTSDFAGRITLEGIISSLDGSDGKLSAEHVKKAVKRAKDDGIKGLIVQINSCGGAVAASKEIADYIKKLDIPTVGLIRDVAASGGYMVASACDYVIAHECAVVGSIGSPFREMTVEEVAIVRETLESIHEMFVECVASNRDMGVENVRQLATGRTYMGKKAKELGLVDSIGGIDDAVQYLKDMTGISGLRHIDYQVVSGRGLLGYFSKMSYACGNSFANGMIDAVKSRAA